MEIIKTVAHMQAYSDQKRAEGGILGLVPTMGGLHKGHLSLVEHAKEEADHVIVSIFVNPTQFSPGEDFETYPRNFDRDYTLLREIGGVDAVFAPSEETLYPEGIDQQEVWLTCAEMTRHLCGKYRLGHFEGVLTVVMKLFAACKPHISVFGLKDIQQYVLLKKMVQDLSLGIKIIGAPTVRESNGLACSSRNEHLSAEERIQAEVLSRAVTMAKNRIQSGEGSPASVTALMKDVIQSAPLAKLQYAEIVALHSLHPMKQFTPGIQVIAAVAVYFREVRLIDNAVACVPMEQVRTLL